MKQFKHLKVGKGERGERKVAVVFQISYNPSSDHSFRLFSSFVSASVDLFHIIKTDEGIKQDVEEDLNTIVSLLRSELPQICGDEKSVQVGNSITDKISKSNDAIKQVFKRHQGLDPFGKEDETILRRELKEILYELCNVSDFMEVQQQNLCLRIVSRAFRHLAIMKDTRSDYRLKEKLAKMLEDFKLMTGTLRRRSEVLGEAMGPVRDVILREVAAVESLAKPLITAVQTVVASDSESNIATLDSTVMQLASHFSTLITTLKDQASLFASESSFDYTSLEEALAALREALEAGNRENTIMKAQQITKQIKDLEDDGSEDLANSISALKGLTARLLTSAKANLQDPSTLNKAEMSRVMDGMKDEAHLVVLKTKPATSNSAAMKKSLLESAQSLSQEMNGMSRDGVIG